METNQLESITCINQKKVFAFTQFRIFNACNSKIAIQTTQTYRIQQHASGTCCSTHIVALEAIPPVAMFKLNKTNKSKVRLGLNNRVPQCHTL